MEAGMSRGEERIDSGLLCPSCQLPLKPLVLGCGGCGIRVEGPFELNEFSTLSRDDLHFLRIFVHSEGRVRDMQAALGLSYPTVRARIAALKNRIIGDFSKPERTAKPVASATPAEQVLERLARGEIDFDQALENIRRLKIKKTEKGE